MMSTKPVNLHGKRDQNGHGGASHWDALRNADNGPGMDWGVVDAEELLAAVVAVTEDGAAVLLSKTSDGGALVIQVWSGTDRYKLYPTSVGECHDVLTMIQNAPKIRK